MECAICVFSKIDGGLRLTMIGKCTSCKCNLSTIAYKLCVDCSVKNNQCYSCGTGMHIPDVEAYIRKLDVIYQNLIESVNDEFFTKYFAEHNFSEKYNKCYQQIVNDLRLGQYNFYKYQFD